MNKRIAQINDFLLKEIGQIINKELTPPADCLITLTKVATARDLKTARVFFTVLPSAKKEAMENFFKRKAGLIKKYLAKKITFYCVPQISYFYDQQEDKAERIERILDKLSGKS